MAVNELEVYDRAMFDFFRLKKEECKTPVPSVFAPPQRAFAALKELYSKQGLDPDELERDRVFLPATALHRDVPVFDPEKFRFTDRWINSYRSPPGHKKVDVMGPPQTVTIPYTLEIWAYTQVELLWIHRQLISKFRGPLAYIVVDLQEYGKKRLSIRDDGLQDASVLEPQEEERSLRSTMNVSLSAPIFRSLETLRTVLTVETQVRDLETDELLSSSEVVAE